jgi:NADH dehydrogenase [ubiquinone] 1 alpha subcomplex assembly factor 5
MLLRYFGGGLGRLARLRACTALVHQQCQHQYQKKFFVSPVDGALSYSVGGDARGPKGNAACSSRSYSVKIFDTQLKTLHRDRVVKLRREDPDRLPSEIAHRLVDRLEDCTRSFQDVLVVGGSGLQVAEQILKSPKSRSAVKSITYAESSPALLQEFEEKVVSKLSDSGISFKLVRLRENEESLQEALSEKSFDAAISCLGLHWVNDLPSALLQIKKSLREDAFFIGAFLGGETTQELRISCSIAEMEREGGVSPRTSPLARVRDAGNLIIGAGFSLPVVDVDTISIRYKSVAHLVDHLRRLGESNANVNRRGFLIRDSALAAAAVYHSLFAESDDTISSTYQIIYISGWTPHSSQQKPMQRGTATASFKDLQKELTDNKEGK